MPKDPVNPSERSGIAGRSADMALASAGSASSKLTGRSRDRFEADELAIVLSHFDIGVIDAIQEFPRGSRRAPKSIIRSEQGLFLLKRRARGKDDPFKVAFSHALQLYLASKQFPLPHLVGTKKENNSMLQHKSGIYELFEYIKGTGYDNSLPATTEAGRILALFHKLLADYEPEYEPPMGSYHAARSVATAFERIPTTFTQLDPHFMELNESRVSHVLDFLRTSYNEAAAQVNSMGLPDWPMQIVHADWHPGNMLFRANKIVAVIDYDAARIQQRIIDVANGALQFSILGGGDDPNQWPEYLDETRFKRFLRGYESVPNCVLSKAELRTIPWLMVEALIAEAAIPIAATGSFARIEGMGFLEMVERKVKWMHEGADRLAQAVEG